MISHRRRACERCAGLPDRSHALRRCEIIRSSREGIRYSIRRHDRNAPHGRESFWKARRSTRLDRSLFPFCHLEGTLCRAAFVVSSHVEKSVVLVNALRPSRSPSSPAPLTNALGEGGMNVALGEEIPSRRQKIPKGVSRPDILQIRSRNGAGRGVDQTTQRGEIHPVFLAGIIFRVSRMPGNPSNADR